MIYRIENFVSGRALLYVGMLLLSVLLCSCPHIEPSRVMADGSCGYPKIVTFHGSGEKKTISGEREIFMMEISGSMVSYNENNNCLYYKKDWLTIILQPEDNRFYCIAEQNPTEKKRNIYIELIFASQFWPIDLIQDGNAEAASN